MKFGPSLIAIVLTATPAFAFAGGKAVIEAGAGEDSMRSSIEYDGARLRLDVTGQADTYMVMREGRIYSVTQQDGGQPMVIDLAGMGQLLGGMAQQSMASMSNDVGEFISLDDTGRSETVAGIKGRVYVLTYVDADGERRSDEIVLGKDGRLREMTESMELMSRTMAQAFGVAVPGGSERLKQEILGKGSGMLRFGSEYRLVSIDAGTPADARFTLPAAPQQMPDFGNLMSGANAGASGSASGGNPLGDIFGQKVQRQQDRVENRADQEVDQATDETVDQALDKAFKNLFGD